MTDIPGTGKVLQSKPPQTITVLNIDELKKSKVPKLIKEPLKWHEKLHYWILFGCAGGIFFVFLALINIKFLYLAPIGPISAIISWFIKEIFRKPVKKTTEPIS